MPKGEWKDDRLAIRALRERWEIPADRLPEVIARVVKIATSEVSADRDVTAALRALVQVDKLKLQSIELEMRLEEHAELLDRVRRLEGEGASDGERTAETPG